MGRSLLRLLAALGVAAACAGPKSAPSPQDSASAAQRNTSNVVTADIIANSGDVSIEKILADRIAGVRLDRTSDGSMTLRIRGTTSWSTDNQPLYVIDGVPLGQMGALTGINKADIARIEVLKDPSRMSMYGSRGASGVILIAMKKPR